MADEQTFKKTGAWFRSLKLIVIFLLWALFSRLNVFLLLPSTPQQTWGTGRWLLSTVSFVFPKPTTCKSLFPDFLSFFPHVSSCLNALVCAPHSLSCVELGRPAAAQTAVRLLIQSVLILNLWRASSLHHTPHAAIQRCSSQTKWIGWAAPELFGEHFTLNVLYI